MMAGQHVFFVVYRTVPLIRWRLGSPYVVQGKAEHIHAGQIPLRQRESEKLS
jgi:hypothetical protein